MKKQTLIPLLLTVCVLFTYCGEDLATFDPPSNFVVNLEITQIDDVTISAVVQQEGDFKILKSGFLINENDFSCDAQVEVMETPLVNNRMTLESIDRQLSASIFVRAFVDIQHPTNGKTNRICSEVNQRNTGDLSLVGSSEFIDRNTIQLNGRLIGLGQSKAADHGFFWIGPVDKLNGLPDLRTVFDTISINKVSFGELLDGDNLFQLLPAFETGQYLSLIHI